MIFKHRLTQERTVPEGFFFFQPKYFLCVPKNSDWGHQCQIWSSCLKKWQWERHTLRDCECLSAHIILHEPHASSNDEAAIHPSHRQCGIKWEKSHLCDMPCFTAWFFFFWPKPAPLCHFSAVTIIISVGLRKSAVACSHLLKHKVLKGGRCFLQWHLC